MSSTSGRRTRVIGWYHSHPKITVLPSHVGKYGNVTDITLALTFVLSIDFYLKVLPPTATLQRESIFVNVLKGLIHLCMVESFGIFC